MSASLQQLLVVLAALWLMVLVGVRKRRLELRPPRDRVRLRDLLRPPRV